MFGGRSGHQGAPKGLPSQNTCATHPITGRPKRRQRCLGEHGRPAGPRNGRSMGFTQGLMESGLARVVPGPGNGFRIPTVDTCAGGPSTCPVMGMILIKCPPLPPGGRRGCLYRFEPETTIRNITHYQCTAIGQNMCKYATLLEPGQFTGNIGSMDGESSNVYIVLKMRYKKNKLPEQHLLNGSEQNMAADERSWQSILLSSFI